MPGRHNPDWESFDFAGPALNGPPVDGPVAFGGDLSPASVLSAYRRGIVPLPAADEYLRTINEFRYEDLVADGTIALVGRHGDPYQVAWWSPDPRPVIGVGQVHLGRNVRKQLRREDMRTTADTAFGRVAEECRTDREPRWLTGTLLRTLAELHADGWAHSIEVWLEGRLIGGAIGIGIGRIISGDSLFGRHQGAGEGRGGGHGRPARPIRRPTHRRAVGQLLPALTRCRAGATRALPAAARPPGPADSASVPAAPSAAAGRSGSRMRQRAG